MKSIKNLMCCVLLLPALVFAQNKENGPLMATRYITVKPGHRAQFISAIKQWEECYKKNNGSSHLDLWHRFQGTGTVYVMNEELPNWAEVDKDDPAADKCGELIVNLISPNVENSNFTISQILPKYSGQNLPEGKIVWVRYERVKDMKAFFEVLNDLAAAGKKMNANFQGYFQEVIGGGPEQPNYLTVFPGKDFAEYDKENTAFGPWKAYKKLKGEKATDALYEKYRATIENSWSYIYVLDSNLSF